MADAQVNVLLFAGRFEVRGSSAYTLRLAEHLGAHNIAARVICPDARLVEAGRRAELPITEYRQLGIPVLGRVVMELMRRDLSRDVPDLIHIQSRSVLSQGDWLARQMRRPYVLTVHDYLGPRERLRFDRVRGRRIIAVSQSVKSELLSRAKLSDEMVQVIHSGVALAVETEALPVLDPGHVPVVGAAGPLEAVKGFPFFLGAAQKVLSRRGNVEFLVAGAGPEEGNLRRLVRDLAITEHVTFVPNLLDFSTSLAVMDVYCLPSLRQGLGTIMLEAMAMAKPVIATGVGGVYSVVHDGQTGLVVPPSDSQQLAEKILELLDDPVRARAIGEAGRCMVRQEFGIEKMVDKTARLYREVLAEFLCTLKSSPSARN